MIVRPALSSLIRNSIAASHTDKYIYERTKKSLKIINITHLLFSSFEYLQFSAIIIRLQDGACQLLVTSYIDRADVRLLKRFVLQS